MSTAISLRSAFRALAPESQEPGKLLGARIAGRTADFVARGADGQPLILLSVSPEHSHRAPIQLKHLAVQFEAVCRVKESPDATSEGTFVVVECSAEDPALYDFFLSATEALLESLPHLPSSLQVHECIGSFIELFRKLASPSTRSVKGLWGELFAMSRAGDSARWAQAWHGSAMEKFDFSFPSSRVEVKASEQGLRIHDFALEQLTPPNDVPGFVISMLLRKSAGGTGVLELTERLAGKLAGRRELVTKLWANVAEALGNDFCADLDVLFDEEYAAQSLCVIPSSAIPRPGVTEPDKVFGVRFKANVSHLVAAATLPLDAVVVETTTEAVPT